MPNVTLRGIGQKFWSMPKLIAVNVNEMQYSIPCSRCNKCTSGEVNLK